MDHPAIDRDSVVWRKSSYSGYAGNCAEVAQDGGRVLVRDSKDPGGPVLVYSPAAWAEFLDKVKATPIPPLVGAACALRACGAACAEPGCECECHLMEDESVHLAPMRGDGILSCCGRGIYQVPAGSVTIIAGEVTCSAFAPVSTKVPDLSGGAAGRAGRRRRGPVVQLQHLARGTPQMVDWPTELAAEIKAAIAAPGETVIRVPNEIRKKLAESALERMAPGCTRVTFVVG